MRCGAQTTPPEQKTPEPKPSLGVALTLPSGQSIAYPIQTADSDEKALTPIPIPGYDNISGIRIYPHMVEDRVGVRITVMVNSILPGSTAPVDMPKPIGDYAIGHLGDSMRIADLSKVGLPALEVKVVSAKFWLDTREDPCCSTADDPPLFCCGRTFVLMCANCEAVCPSLFGCSGSARRRQHRLLDVDVPQESKPASAKQLKEDKNQK